MAFLSRTAVAQQPRWQGRVACPLRLSAFRGAAGQAARTKTLQSGFPSRPRARCRATPARLLTEPLTEQARDSEAQEKPP